MRELNMYKKVRVIKLFLNGIPYDDIVQQTGVAKGSVVKIIDDFRKGRLPMPPGMTEYIDALRQVAVDLRKNNTSVIQAKSYLRIHTKLHEMGVDIEQTEQWLEICQGIASSSVTNNDFVGAALELAQSVSETGLSYADLLADYQTKLKILRSTEKEVQQRQAELNKITQQKEQVSMELDSITRATAAACEAFQKQKEDLKTEQGKYLTESKLSWGKINLVKAVIDSDFKGTGLSKTEIKKLRNKIVTIGSITRATKQLEEKKNRLINQINDLAVYQQHYYNEVSKLVKSREQAEIAIKEIMQAGDKLDSELDTKRTELAAVKQEVANHIENLYVSRLIIDFLFSPNGLGNSDLDRLVGMMIALRQKRLGIGPKRVTDANGKIMCQCQIPSITIDFESYEVDTNHAREAFTLYLAPLVRDKFVSRFEYDLAEMSHKISKETAIIEATIAERGRHII
jgi:hypothetical protein